MTDTDSNVKIIGVLKEYDSIFFFCQTGWAEGLNWLLIFTETPWEDFSKGLVGYITK